MRDGLFSGHGKPPGHGGTPPGQATPPQGRPNILFILMDNLGYGEPGCYGGGITRGAPTPNIDNLAEQGMRLTNYCVEPQCTPSRSAILTGRHPIRSGTHSVPIGSDFDGLTQWEITIAELLSSTGYATAAFGKWHLGSTPGRFPNDQGFDVWYGIPRSSDESLWPGNPKAAEAGVRPEYIMEGVRGQEARETAVYDLEQRRSIDRELTNRAIDFMRRQTAANTPWYCYLPYTQPHFPTLPNHDYAGKTGHGDFADSLAEMDHHVGQLVAAVDELGVADNTIVVFTSDNGPDPEWPWSGTSGPWEGYYFTHSEGSCRVPFIMRWPGRVEVGRVSNELVHEVDTYTTFAAIAGATVPTDRAVDGVDQTDFFCGKEVSDRAGYLVWVGDILMAIVWKEWKMMLYDKQVDWFTPPGRLTMPKVYNLIQDPKEHFTEQAPRNTWVAHPMAKMAGAFFASFEKDPPIAPGTPDPYTPPTGAQPLAEWIRAQRLLMIGRD